MYVVNLYGGPCSGKSTCAAGLFYTMKLNHLKVELVTEFAKDMVYAGRLEHLLDQQEYIFAKQNHRLHNVRNHVDFAIIDSPLLLSLVYASQEWPCINEFGALVRATYNTYDNINIFLERPEEFQQCGRMHDLEQSIKIDNEIKNILDAYDQKFTCFKTNTNVVKEIYDFVVVPLLNIA